MKRILLLLGLGALFTAFFINISTQVPVSALFYIFYIPEIKSMLFHDWKQNLFCFLFIFFSF